MNNDTTPTRSRAFAALRTLLPFLRPYRGLMAAWLSFLVLSSTATLALPVAVRLMIDHGFSGQNPDNINKWFLGLFGVAVLLAVASAGRFFCISLLGEKVVADLRERVFNHILTLDMDFFARTRAGELISRLAADTELLRSVVASTLSVALRSLVTMVGSGVALLITSPRLAGMAAVVIPIIILPIVLYGRRVQKLSRANQDRIADTNAHASETLSAIHTVQSYARENHESRRFGAAVRLAIGSARKRIGMQAGLTATVILLVFGAITGVLWIGAKDVIVGTMSAGTLGQFVLYAVIGAGSIGALTEVWSEMQRAGGGMSRIEELLNERSAVVQPKTPVLLPERVRGELHFDAVTFHYPARPNSPALHGFTLHVKPGETVALVGPSGAGKSTVLQLLLRFYDPDNGTVRLDGHALTSLDPQQLRSQIALVPQDPTLFGESARDNIRYGRLEATDDEIIDAATIAEADAFLRALPEGYDTWLGERGVRLSGGQQQRIAIARAILKDAPVLLLDEATSALDAQNERDIQNALERLMKGRTTIVIAHRLATVRSADRIIVLDGGKIVAEGTHDSLIADGGLYAELARLQFNT